MPYKKIKDSEDAAGTGKGKAKIIKGKLTKIHSANPKGICPLIKEGLRVDITKSTKGANVSGKTLTTSPKSGVQMQKNDGSKMEKAKSSTIEKENAAVSKDKSVKVDFGTQSMKSMIGIKKVKTKPINSWQPNETVMEDENVTQEEYTKKEK